MKRKILFLIIIEILIYSYFITNICYADDDFGFLNSELAGNYEPVATPDPPSSDSGPGYIPDDSPTPTDPGPTEPTFSITVPTAIQGFVFEDIDREQLITKDEGENMGMAGTKYITNNFKYDKDEPKIEGIRVGDTTTGPNGEYSFKGAGTYNITFTYGQGINKDNYILNKNTLKYNAQDYNMVVMKDGGTRFEENYFRKVKEIEKSFTEVYIVIDHSASMTTIQSGEKKARIKIVTEAAINFVEELFEEAEGNIAVGYIAFGYEAVIIKKPTDIQEDIIDAIRNFKVESGVGLYSGEKAEMYSSLNHTVGTNIGGAVIKTKNSYISDTSNKVMVLFSDGAASAHEGVQSIYIDDTNEEKAAKLEQVVMKTKEDIKAVIDSEITLINILNQTQGKEKEYVEKTFGDVGYYEVDYTNEEAIAKALLNDTMEIIEKTESEFISYVDEKAFNGDDNKERRKQVNSYYDEIYYDKLKLFEAIDKLNGTEANDIKVISDLIGQNEKGELSDSEQKRLYQKFIEQGNNPNSDLGKFLQNSWMTTEPVTVELYGVSHDSQGRVSGVFGGGNSISFSYYTDEDGVACCTVTDSTGSHDYKASNVSVNEITITVNAALIRRDEFKLELDKIVTGVRLTLSDGHVLYNMISSNAHETVAKNKEVKEAYCKRLQKINGLIDDFDCSVKKLDIEEVGTIPDLILLTVDSDLLQGATLEVEYTLIVKNNSKNATFSEGFSIVDYFDNSLIYMADNKLLTEEGKNSDYNWQVLDQSYLNSKLKYISDNVIEYGSGEKECLYIDFNKSEYERKENIPNDGNTKKFETKSKYVNPVIGNNGERYVKVVLSRVLSSDIVSEFCFKNQAEIVKYRNNNSRREIFLEKDSTGVVIKSPISGNYIPTKSSQKLPDYFTNINEIDTAVATKICLVPPTGETSNKINYIILVEVLVASAAYIIIRKKFKRKL